MNKEEVLKRVQEVVEPLLAGRQIDLVELTYQSGIPDAPFKFTSGIKVVPDVRPFEGKVYKGR